MSDLCQIQKYNEMYVKLTDHLKNLRMYPWIDYTWDEVQKCVARTPDPVLELLQFIKLEHEGLHKFYHGVECLQPCATIGGVHTFSRARDLLYGVYIPASVETFTVRVIDQNAKKVYSKFTIDCERRARYDENLLDACKVEPLVQKNNRYIIDSILFVSPNGIDTNDHECTYTHIRGHDTLVINGIVHKRWLLFEPCLPLVSMQASMVQLVFHADVLFYSEIATLMREPRYLLAQEKCVILRTSYLHNPIVRILNGKMHLDAESCDDDVVHYDIPSVSAPPVNYTQKCSLLGITTGAQI